MPSLTALSSNALVFDSAYAVYPESIKGLFSILCSTSPAFDVDAEAYGGVACSPLPGALRRAGYRTAMFHSGRFAYLGMEAIIGNRGFEVLEDAGHIGGNHESSFGVDEPSTVARMLSWIDGLPHGERFFLMYLPIAGHHPYDSPGRGVFPNADEFGRYRNALRYGDEALGALIDGLRARGLGDNTLWIVFGDHGEAFGQHEGNYGHTFYLYDENVRVPFVVSAPGLTQGRTRVRRVVSLLDTAPTILDLLGLKAPAGYQGASMLDATPRMALFFTDYSRPLAGLRDGPWKFVYELDAARGRLFDSRTDAGERIDVATDHRDRAAWYAEVLRGWSAAQKHLILISRAVDG
jgi:arylsulfatase A-like enzyme